MILGSIQLPVSAVNGMPVGDSWSYASHAVIEGPEKKQFVARNGRTINLSVKLHAATSAKSPEALHAELVALGDAHEALVLQENNGRIRGTFVIEAVDMTPIQKLPDGTIIAMSLTIKLTDPGLERALDIPAKPIATVGTTAVTTSVPKAEDRSTPVEGHTPLMIARR